MPEPITETVTDTDVYQLETVSEEIPEPKTSLATTPSTAAIQTTTENDQTSI
jgi:hypothetical protein